MSRSGVTREDVLHVAALARLQLEPEEVERMADQLADILEHVEALQQASLEQVDEGDEGMVRLAEDVPAAEALLRPLDEIAPSWQDRFFTVPRLSAMEQVEDGAELEGG